ncbi:crossover junction endodeoxyribonuclease RuvC [Pedobacter flavus]|uniref:Crossover junction endodeoxyribonuclease RuvC n=1 Tax=Pedobacter flavus TaxID=3113906 RepID=A0ABU7H0S2_9SPHI|nr:crossover junction endodeoxyribonuclease RuvC [Pedobacter sp. VNH31]MEE1884841.1 crossover junction endodeoxyribonuclease RuvC [Pedobacter sp. VNH31]
MLAEKKERIILGIDPGTSIMGYGIILERGSKLELITMGIVRMDHLDDPYLKLQRVFEKTLHLIEDYNPDALAIESPFFGKNIQVVLKLGRAQGVAMAAALTKNIPVTEYAPRKIKQSITGNGNASKEQVAAMLQKLLKFKETPEFLDATDGLAIAVCHAFQRMPTGSTKSYSGWEAFVAGNKKRVK